MMRRHSENDAQMWSKRDFLSVAHPKILIVDDQAQIAEPLSVALSMNGWETRFVLDGVSALEELDAWSPDVIILDIAMPIIDGFVTARMIRNSIRGREVAIIAHTAMPKALVECPAKGDFDGYCQKGDSLHTLEEMIRNLTGRDAA